MIFLTTCLIVFIVCAGISSLLAKRVYNDLPLTILYGLAGGFFGLVIVFCVGGMVYGWQTPISEVL